VERGKSWGRFYHVEVANRRRWAKATDVRVMLLKVEEPGAGGQLRQVLEEEIQLLWQRSEMMPQRVTVGTPARADLISVMKHDGQPDRIRFLQMHLMWQPNYFDNFRPLSGSMTITLQARSNEADSNLLALHVDWDGNWHDGDTEMQQHLRVSQVAS
jgi:hypothetical protein